SIASCCKKEKARWTPTCRRCGSFSPAPNFLCLSRLSGLTSQSCETGATQAKSHTSISWRVFCWRAVVTTGALHVEVVERVWQREMVEPCVRCKRFFCPPISLTIAEYGPLFIGKR